MRRALAALLLGGVHGGAPGAEQENRTAQVLLQRLVIKADEHFPGLGVEPTLFQGEVRPGFRCDEPGGEGQAEDLASMAFRKLEFSILPQSSSLASVLGLAEAPEAPGSLWVTEAKVAVVGGTELPLLTAALDLAPATDGSLEVSENDQFENEVTLNYDCWQPGGALVQLHLRLADDLGSSAQVCLAWRKVCGKGFEGLEVRHGEWQILPEPETAAKPPLLAPEGILEDVTKLQLRASGALRLKMPRASSSSEMLKVEIRGPLMETEAIEVSPEETAEISVVYRCLGEGVADVELALEHAVLSTSHAPEVLHLHWRKHCGDDEVYRFLDIFLKGDMNLSKTQAVSQGVALPGFAHCRKRTGSAVDGTRPLTPECEAAKPALEIPAKDGKTTVELKLAAEGQMLPPALQHQPDLSFDRKILRAYVMQPLDLFRPRGKVANPSQLRATSQNMVVRYSCHKAGVSLVVVTIYILKHKPIDFAWQKRCAEPKAKVGKALTAPQAMTFAFLVCGLIGLVVCMVCLFCSSNHQEKQMLFQGGRRGPKGGRNIEFQAIGAAEDEIVFHS